MKKYAILFAMKEEATALIEELKAELIENDYFEIYKKDSVYIGISKVGLINASSCFAYINQKFEIDYFINAGLVGTFDPQLSLLESVVVENSFLGNADATGFGYKLGQIPGMEKWYSSDKELLEVFKDLKKVDICSSDTFINSQEQIDKIIKPLSDKIKIFDMECFGFFQSAYIFKKPIIALKVISDHIDNGCNELQFSQILKQGSVRISEVILEILK
ncbi:5'-methylthioadenosine/S-adenosylhomocysteine nucleosidase [Spiroplasma diminutum]|uniref:adenosylhomocysteine nucleosidase n=1 Tax=Spiroplasma diminutum CUAS-1 TaxID=1276221 RepID=S5LWW0_9MOLU|nr:5'-methylthioadenosine/S-adenosylhomocysteine nucleosidase [Spiroplasma diminutum]AGR42269.1 5'-methylthioadenosine/S-adenosylhomocysteine nucleosidase [Spiroplasma diminutum CUAS-1]